MKMKRIFSFTFAILLAVSASRPALAAEGEVFPPEPEPTEEVQIPEETTPPVSEEPPAETDPPASEDPPAEADPPASEDPPAEADPPASEDPSEETDPPVSEDPPAEADPPASEIPPDGALPPVEEPPVTEEEVIDVVVPATGQVILNPYCLPVDTDAGTTSAQVIHQPQEIVNYSSFPVVITAAAAGTLEGDAWLVSTPPAGDAAEKELFLYAEFQSSPDFWTGSYTGASNQLLVNDCARDVLTLTAGGTGYFRLFGDMTPFPQNMWDNENALTVTISYTFSRDPASITAEPETPDSGLQDSFPEQGEPVILPEEPLKPVDPEEPDGTEEPTGAPETPTEDPETPAEDPETPVEDIETPVEDTEPPAEDPETPTDSLETPTDDSTKEPPGTPPPLEPYDTPVSAAI